MMRCPICQQTLSLFAKAPYAPICSEACRREALRRAGSPDTQTAAALSAQPQFEQLRATHLYCPTCRQSMPTTERLLLTLPTGELHGYRCAECGADVGTRTDTNRSSS